MTKKPDPQEAFRTAIQGLMNISEGLKPLTELCVGFRAELERQGYSPTMAEMIASELHVSLIRKIFEPQP